jgi:glycerol-3-phosphate acyltransferase PlsY
MFFADLLILSVLLSYLLGSIPTAMLVSRSHSVDIFSTGTGLPGAANVYREVGHKSGFLVSAGDVAKGSLAVIVANRLGIDPNWLIMPTAAAVFGHWNSIFTRFRGGDGLATLLGATAIAIPFYGFIAVFSGAIVGAFFRKTSYPTIRGGLAVYGFLLMRAAYSQETIILTLGITTIGLMVLAHAMIGHRRRKHVNLTYRG